MAELRERLGWFIQDAMEVARRIGRLSWFGHLERKKESDWVTECRFLEVEGKRGRVKPAKTWHEVVSNDMRMLGINSGMAQDRASWMSLIWGNRLAHVNIDDRR